MSFNFFKFIFFCFLFFFCPGWSVLIIQWLLVVGFIEGTIVICEFFGQLLDRADFLAEVELDELQAYEVANLTDDVTARLSEQRLALAYAVGLTLSADNTRVEKAELLLRGQDVDITVDAHHIWPAAEENVVLTLRLDTGSFKFPGGGLESDSQDQSSFQHGFSFKGGNTMGEDKKAQNLGNFSLKMVFKSPIRKDYELLLFPGSLAAAATPGAAEQLAGVSIYAGKMFAWNFPWMIWRSTLPPPLILPGKPFRVLPNAPPTKALLTAMENVFSPPRTGACGGNREEKPTEKPGDRHSLTYCT